MLNYIIKNSDYKLDVSLDNEFLVLDMTIQKYLNKMLCKELTDMSSRETVAKRVFGYKAKVPLYINKETLLLCIRSYRLVNSFYINYYSIKNHVVEKDHVIIYFLSNNCMKIPQKSTFLKQFLMCKEIDEFLF